ncbi:MAG TPA: hypothetical protein VI603_13120 [Saprospiraceae bacterium]|nr:hypothetical protein [Saprospiraceae bacterium]
MKYRICFTMVVIMMCMSSCIFTFYPLYSEDKLSDMPGLEGSFQADMSGSEDSEVWTFTRDSKGIYQLMITEGSKTGTLEIHVVRLGDEYFIDILPAEFESDRIPDFVLWNLMPVYTIAKLESSGNNLKMLFFDPAWLEEKLSSHKIRIAHEVRRQDGNTGDIEFILLTARTGELQKFVEKYASYKEAYDDGTFLTRLTAR